MAEDWKDQLAKKTGYAPPPTSRENHSFHKREAVMNRVVFYKDDAKTIMDAKYLDAQAKEWAKDFINHKLTSTQLRRFHNDVRELEAKIDAVGEDGFGRMLPMVKMIKSKVAYACSSSGKERKIPKEFRDYMETMINSIVDMKDFQAFSKCFEAVVGYYYGEGGR